MVGDDIDFVAALCHRFRRAIRAGGRAARVGEGTRGDHDHMNRPIRDASWCYLSLIKTVDDKWVVPVTGSGIQAPQVRPTQP